MLSKLDPCLLHNLMVLIKVRANWKLVAQVAQADNKSHSNLMLNLWGFVWEWSNFVSFGMLYVFLSQFNWLTMLLYCVVFGFCQCCAEVKTNSPKCDYCFCWYVQLVEPHSDTKWHQNDKINPRLGDAWRYCHKCQPHSAACD